MWFGDATSPAIAGLARGLLYGIEAADPLALAGGLIILFVEALATAYLPAQCVSRV